MGSQLPETAAAMSEPPFTFSLSENPDLTRTLRLPPEFQTFDFLPGDRYIIAEESPGCYRLVRLDEDDEDDL